MKSGTVEPPFRCLPIVHMWLQPGPAVRHCLSGCTANGVWRSEGSTKVLWFAAESQIGEHSEAIVLLSGVTASLLPERVCHCLVDFSAWNWLNLFVALLLCL